jgi:peptidoglycan-N-acetylmuramic acid deacetylase
MKRQTTKLTKHVLISTLLAFALTACSSEPIAEPAPTESPKTPEPAAQVVPAPPVPAPQAAMETPQPAPAKEEPAPSQETVPSSVYNGGVKNPAAAAIGTPKPAAKPSGTASDKTPLSWYYMKKPKGQVPNFPADTKKYTEDMKALYVGTGKKVYLTIDTGGALGDIDTLIQSLKDHDAKANFFIAGYNVKKNPDYVRRLVADGHLVANHTMTHTDMTTQSDEQVRKEIHDFEKLIKDVTGQDVQPYFRFPYGRYNLHLLKMVSDMGYTSVFWSTAMRDWEPRKNGAEDPYNDIMNNLHDGNIILMHQGSPENIEALDRIVKEVKKAGYEFALLSDITPPKDR